MTVTEGEIEGKCLPGRRRTAWIDDVRRWTEGGLPVTRRIALDRVGQKNHKHCSETSTALQREILAMMSTQFNHRLKIPRHSFL